MVSVVIQLCRSDSRADKVCWGFCSVRDGVCWGGVIDFAEVGLRKVVFGREK